MAGVGQSAFISTLVELLTTTPAERARIAAAAVDSGAAAAPQSGTAGEPLDPRPYPAALAQAEAALRRKSAELQAVMDALPALVFVAHGADGSRIAANRFAAEALRLQPGRAIEMVIGSGDRAGQWRLVQDGADLHTDEFPVQKAARGTEARNAEFDLVFRDAGSCTLFGNAVPVRDAAGECHGSVGVFLDVTARRRAEDELRRAKEAADRASQAKTYFLAAASHDLRQPLQSLSALVTMLAVRERDPAKLQLIERADRTIANLGKLLDAVLDVSQLDAGVIRPNISDFPVERLLSMIGEEFELTALEKALRFKVHDHDAWVRSDLALLGRMVRNIVSNAMKYTPQGGAVEVSCAAGAGHLEIAVADTGIGIPPSQHSAIFEEFRQLMNPRHDPSQGLGLGLAIVSRMARLLGHRVALRSAPDRGSTFTIAVPLGVKPDARPAERASGPVPHGHRQRVLLVDDDELVAGALRDMLEMFGFDVVAVSSTAAAADQIGKAAIPFYAIMADYRLPAGTGLDAIDAARRRFPAIQAIVLTGDTYDAALASVEAQGIRLLRKPVSMAVLGDLLSGGRPASEET